MDRDAIIERGRDVREMELSPGWQAVKGQLEADIAEAEAVLKRIDIDRGPAEVGAEYIAIIQRVSGLRRAFEIIESMKEDRVREEQNDNETQG